MNPSDIVLLSLFALGIVLVLPNFLNLFVFYRYADDKGLTVKRLLWGTVTIPWKNVKTVKSSSFSRKILEVDLMTVRFFQIHRGYFLHVGDGKQVLDAWLDKKGLRSQAP